MQLYARRSEILVHGCSVLLGINSLISTNGLWMELPILIHELPEGWALASYLTAIIQLANIAPIIYGILVFLLPGKFTERPWILAMLIDGFIATMLMAMLWDHTISINGKEHSIPLFVLTFFLAIVDALSSVVCLPFMAVLKPIYLNSYMIGEGLSGFVPSVAALIQGVANNPSTCHNSTLDGNYTEIPEEYLANEGLRFTVSSFFYFLGGMMAFSLFGFLLLCHTTLAKREYATDETKKDYNAEKKDELLPLQDLSTMSPFGESYKRFSVGFANDKEGSAGVEVLQAADKPNKKMFYILVGIQAWVSCLSLGAMPSIQSYSCAPYGDVPFHFAIVLSSLASPVAGFIAIWVPLNSLKKIAALTVFGTGLASYLMLLAVMSPTPPMVNTVLGSFIMVAGWIAFSAIFGYVKVAVACLLRDIGHSALFWCGVATQIGATVGAIVLFIFVNVLGYFVEDSQC